MEVGVNYAHIIFLNVYPSISKNQHKSGSTNALSLKQPVSIFSCNETCSKEMYTKDIGNYNRLYYVCLLYFV